MLLIFISQLKIICAFYMYIANPNGNLDGWSILNAQFPYLTNCAGITIFGGFDENTMISRSFIRTEVPNFDFTRVDSLSTADLEVELDQDNFAESMSTQINDQQNYCGQNDKNEYIKSISFQLEHTKDIVNIFTKIKQNNQQRLQWGILKMEFQLDICYIGCTYCSGPKQSDCQSWHNLFYSFENTLFSNLIEINHQTHEFSQYYECSQCERILNIDFVQTNTNTQVQLKENFLINQEIILQLYDDGTMQISMILDYGIREFNFRLYSRWGSVAQQVQIQYQLIYHVDEIEFPFFPGCLNYLNKQCMQCQEGWKFNTIEKQCQPICGNQKIEGYEECDDGNFKAHDGCFECKYSCIQNCIHCQMGICEQCASGFKFDEKMENCLPICGDGMLVPQISQVCNDGNLIQEEDCYQCRQECDEYCSICIYFYCFQCMEGFQMVNGMCNPICGDKIVLPEFEECDDGNNQKNDGCHECKLSCYDGCEVCEKGICKIDCKLLYGQGYYFIEDSCQSICGDGIIAINEECDDGNEIEFDGCFNCRYTCETNCLDCKQGECSTYQSICGNFKLEGEEQCDDGNQDPNDGCYYCFVEPSWKCKNTSDGSFCSFINPPQFISNFRSINNNKQLVLFQFNQNIKIMNGQNLTESMILEVLNVPVEQQVFKFINKKEPIKDEVQEIFYEIQIEITTILDFKPILSIDLNATILNHDDIKLEQEKYQLRLEVPQYLEKKQEQQSNNIKDMNSYIIYGLLSIGSITLLFGQPQIFTEILDMLQYISYLKYINISFPKNLFIFFQISDLVSISLIDDYINFQEMQKQLIPQNDILPQFGKFQIYEQNADLISNINTQIIQFFGLVLLFLFRRIINKLVYKFFMDQRMFLLIKKLYSKLKNKFFLGLIKAFQNAIRKLIQNEKYLTKRNLIKIMIINGWDLNFKSFLYLKSFENYQPRNLISIILSILIIVSYGFIVIHEIKTLNTLKVNQKKQLIQQRYQALNLLKQMFFLFVLIFFYQSEVVQLVLLFASSLASTILIINVKKMLGLQMFITLIFQEGSILFFIISCLAYTNDFSFIFSSRNKIQIGWIHMAFLSTIIAFPLLRLAKNAITAGKTKLLKFRKQNRSNHQIFLS